ncbi:MAG TPA: hypothetical protein VF812_18885 [Ktedonobacterales bacterium]
MPERSPAQSVARLALRLCLLGALVALALAGCAISQAPSPPPVAVPTVTAAPTVTATATAQRPLLTPVAGLLQPAPMQCPLAPALQSQQFSHFGGFSGSITLLGGGPAWIAGPYFPTHLHLDSQGYTPWPSTKIIWEIGPNAHEPVTITVRNLQTGAPGYWFFNVREPQAAPTLVLDPDAPASNVVDYHGVPEPGWQEWGSGLLLFSAGCYEMDVTSAAGSWRTIFAAGR